MYVRWILSALGLFATAAACGSPGAGSTQTKGPHRFAAPSPATRFTGVAAFSSGDADGGTTGHRSVLAFHDPRSGRVTVKIPFAGITGEVAAERESFSPDWRYVVWRNAAGSVELGRFDDARGDYVSAGAVSPPKPSFGGDEVTYDSPRFSPVTGRLWVRSYKPPAAPALLSIDPRSPAAAPRPERTPSGLGGNWHFDPVGAPIGSGTRRATLTDASGGKVRLDYAGAPTAIARPTVRVAGSGATYEFAARIDGTTFLAKADLMERPSRRYGAVIKVHADLPHRSATVERVLPDSTDTVYDVLLGPDRKGLLVRTTKGWFRTELGSGAQPQQTFGRLEDPEGLDDTSLLGWY